MGRYVRVLLGLPEPYPSITQDHEKHRQHGCSDCATLSVVQKLNHKAKSTGRVPATARRARLTNYSGRRTAFRHCRQVNASILEKPGNRFTDPQCGHISLATSRVISRSVSVCPTFAAGTVRSTAAFIADNISLIPANDAVQAAAALRIAKV